LDNLNQNWVSTCKLPKRVFSIYKNTILTTQLIFFWVNFFKTSPITCVQKKFQGNNFFLITFTWHHTTVFPESSLLPIFPLHLSIFYFYHFSRSNHFSSSSSLNLTIFLPFFPPHLSIFYFYSIISPSNFSSPSPSRFYIRR
jgi:hypothetical protein